MIWFEELQTERKFLEFFSYEKTRRREKRERTIFRFSRKS
jgi:hypothetical protein